MRFSYILSNIRILSVHTSFMDSRHSALRVYLAILVTNPSPKEIQLFLPKTDRVEQYLILKVLIQWFHNSFQIWGTSSVSVKIRT